MLAERPYLVDAKFTDFFGINCTSAVNSIFVKNAAGTSASYEHNARQLRRDQDRAWRQRDRRSI